MEEEIKRLKAENQRLLDKLIVYGKLLDIMDKAIRRYANPKNYKKSNRQHALIVKDDGELYKKGSTKYQDFYVGGKTARQVQHTGEYKEWQENERIYT